MGHDVDGAAKSIVPGAEIWDDDDDTWIHDAQTVVHPSDSGPHDGSRGVEADDDDTTLALGSKIQRWAGSSALGASLAGFGIAIDKVLFDRDPTQIEIQAEDDTDSHPKPIQVKINENDPQASMAVLRPWLNDQGDSTN